MRFLVIQASNGEVLHSYEATLVSPQNLFFSTSFQIYPSNLVSIISKDIPQNRYFSTFYYNSDLPAMIAKYTFLTVNYVSFANSKDENGNLAVVSGYIDSTSPIRGFLMGYNIPQGQFSWFLEFHQVSPFNYLLFIPFQAKVYRNFEQDIVYCLSNSLFLAKAVLVSDTL